MDVKEAAQVAKTYVRDLFMDEGISDVGLEEIECDGGYWRITIGFSRPWDHNIGSVLGGKKYRAYKIVEITDETGNVLSVKDRNLPKSQ